MKKIQGLYTALITPFTESGDLDEKGLRENIQFQIAGGVNGLLMLGTTAEAPTLTEEEKDRIVTIAIEEAHGQVPVMVGTGCNSTAATIKRTEHMQQLGADSVLVVTPYYNKPTPEGIFQHFRAIAEATDLPICIYNIQGRTGTNIDTPTLQRIATLPNMIGVKEASGNIEQMMDVIDTIGSVDPEFSIMSGDDLLTYPLLTLGGHGVISVVSNLVPNLVAKLVHATASGDFEQARQQHYQLMPLIRAAFSETNPIPIKTAMRLQNMPAGPLRLPLTEMRPENREKLKNILYTL